MKKARIIRWVLGICILLSVLAKSGFLSSLDDAGVHLAWLWIVLSLIIHIYSCWLTSRGWLVLLEALGLPVDAEKQLESYWKGIALNPLGGVWAATLGRFWLSRPVLSDNRSLIGALLWEKVWVCLSAVVGILMFMGLGVLQRDLSDASMGGVGLILAAVSVGIGMLINRRSEVSRSRARWLQVLLYGVAFPSSVMLSLVALTRGLGVSDMNANLEVGRRYIASWMAGQFAIFVPQGLGVREYLFVQWAGQMLPAPWVVAFALWERTLSMIAQMLPGLWLVFFKSPLPANEAAVSYAAQFPADAIYDPESRHRKARRIVRILADAAGQPLTRLSCLDIGCGAGHMTDIFASHFREVIGLDADAATLQAAMQRKDLSPAPRFVTGDAEKLPFPDHSMDVVVLNQVYEHVRDPLAVMAEIRRVLKPKGLCYFSAHNRLSLFDGHYPIPTLSWWPTSLMDSIFRWAGNPSGYPVRLRSYWELQELIQHFNRLDYTIEVIMDPVYWGAVDDMKIGTWPRFIPAGVYRKLYPFLPGYLWVLKPR